MSWELTADVECPHCDEENQMVTVAFNDMEFDEQGGDSHVMQQCCEHCNKEFYFDARVNFEVDIGSVWKTKPKVKK